MRTEQTSGNPALNVVTRFCSRRADADVLRVCRKSRFHTLNAWSSAAATRSFGTAVRSWNTREESRCSCSYRRRCRRTSKYPATAHTRTLTSTSRVAITAILPS